MLKKLTRLLVLGAFMALPMAASAQYSTSELLVTASIGNVCAFENTQYTLPFGVYDYIGTNATTPLDQSTLIRVRCTSGFTGTVTLGQGSNADTGSTDAAPLRRMSDGATSFLSYALYTDAARTATWGNTLATGNAVVGSGNYADVPVYGRVAAGQNRPNGNYSDLVTIAYTF